MARFIMSMVVAAIGLKQNPRCKSRKAEMAWDRKNHGGLCCQRLAAVEMAGTIRVGGTWLERSLGEGPA